MERKIPIQRNFESKEWVRMSIHAANLSHTIRNMQKHRSQLAGEHTENRFSHDDTTECRTRWQISSMLPKHLSANAQGSNIENWRLVRRIREGQRKPATGAANAGVAEMKLKWGNRTNEDMQAVEIELDSATKPPCCSKRPYFQIRWGFLRSLGWRPPPQAGLRGTLDWTSTSAPQMPHAGRHLHIPSILSQPGQAPKKNTKQSLIMFLSFG